jgi:hypothetical protein
VIHDQRSRDSPASTEHVATVPPRCGPGAASPEIHNVDWGADGGSIVTTSTDAMAARTGLADGKALATFRTCAPYRTSDLTVAPGGGSLVALAKTGDGSGHELVTFPVP